MAARPRTPTAKRRSPGVGTGNPESFETVAQAIAKKYNATINYIPIPDNIKNQYQEYTCANLNKLNSVIDMDWTSIKEYINANGS